MPLFGDSDETELENVRLKAIGGGIFDRFFSNFDNCQPEIASDVVSCVIVEPTGIKAHVKLSQPVLEIYDCLTL